MVLFCHVLFYPRLSKDQLKILSTLSVKPVTHCLTLLTYSLFMEDSNFKTAQHTEESES